MSIQELERAVLSENPEAALMAQQVGPAANPKLSALAANGNPKVRLTAINALRETGAPAPEVFAAAVRDPDPQVRGAALAGLWEKPSPQAADAVLEALHASQDPDARRELALIAAACAGEGADAGVRSRVTQSLTNRRKYEKEPLAREGLGAALGKLGDADAQKEFAAGLTASSDRDRARYLEECQAVHQPWLLPPLSLVLADTSPMVRIGIDARPDLPHYLRACDLAAKLIVSIAKPKLSFDPEKVINYTPPQLDEVRAAARAR